MDLNVQVTEELVIGVHVPADGPKVDGLTLDFRVNDEEQLREAVSKLGGVERFHLDPSSHLCARYNVPVTCNGEVELTATLHVWFKRAEPAPQVKYPEIKRLADEAAAIREEELAHG